MANLIEVIQPECNRLREQVLPEYEKLPNGVGMVAATFIEKLNQESRSVDSVRGSSRDGDGAERPEGVQPVGDKRCKHGFPTCLPCGFKDGAKVKGK
jgi:hypothetical protein